MQFNSLTDVLVAELADLYSAEQQLVEALPKMAKAAHAGELRDAFEAHLDETRNHVIRLERAFEDLRIALPHETCEAMQGLLREGDEIIAATGDPASIDAALIGAAQRVEHYEMAGYGKARALAGELGLDQVAALLGETLDEEAKADKTLTKLASGGLIGSGINREAAGS
jgi:ferritin-like metal-binding protein YciE